MLVLRLRFLSIGLLRFNVMIQCDLFGFFKARSWEKAESCTSTDCKSWIIFPKTLHVTSESFISAASLLHCVQYTPHSLVILFILLLFIVLFVYLHYSTYCSVFCFCCLFCPHWAICPFFPNASALSAMFKLAAPNSALNIVFVLFPMEHLKISRSPHPVQFVCTHTWTNQY